MGCIIRSAQQSCFRSSLSLSLNPDFLSLHSSVGDVLLGNSALTGAVARSFTQEEAACEREAASRAMLGGFLPYGAPSEQAGAPGPWYSGSLEVVLQPTTNFFHTCNHLFAVWKCKTTRDVEAKLLVRNF